MKFGSAAVIGMAFAAGALSMAPAQASDLQIKMWASSCASCHGTNGNAQAPMVKLAGADAKATLEALLAHKRGERNGTIMHQIAKGYTDEQLAQLADYFAAQR